MPEVRSRLVPAALLALALVAGATVVAPSPGHAADADTLVSIPPEPHRRGPVRDAGRALRILGSDTWHVVSSPARLDARDALMLGGVIGVTAVLYANDEAILEASQRNRDEPVYRQIVEVGETFEPLGFMGKTNPFYLGALALGYAFDIEPLQVIPAQILESHIIAGGIRNGAKLFIGRRRPFENQGPDAFEFNGGTAFPSGHASVVFELATILSHHARRWPVTVATYGIATTVAVQRVHSRNHWASDVFVPAVTGTLIARSICTRRDQRAWAFVPGVSPTGGPGFQVAFRF